MTRTHPAPLATGLCALLLVAAGCGERSDAPPMPETQAQIAAAAAPDTTPAHDEVERLRALGYVHTVENNAPPGVEPVEFGTRDLARTAPGLTYYTKVSDCSSHLVRLDSSEVHSWSLQPCEVWGNTILLPNGDILAVHHDPYEGKGESETAEAVSDARRLIKLDWDGKLIWSRRMPFHHDVDVMPNGNIASLTYRHRLIPEVHASALSRDHYLVELDANGELLSETSLSEVLLASPEAATLQEVKPHEKQGIREVDHLHANALEFLREPELAKQNPLYSPDNVLICFRHQDMVVIFDWKAKRALWSWGQGEISGPHDATLLANGNVLVFDNGLGRKWSRVVEVDPRTDEIVWEYSAPQKNDFYTLTRGASQRLENGNTLITNSRSGAVFEVTREGDVVWGFKEPLTPSGKPQSRIVRARRLAEADPRGGRPFAMSD